MIYFSKRRLQDEISERRDKMNFKKKTNPAHEMVKELIFLFENILIFLGSWKNVSKKDRKSLLSGLNKLKFIPFKLRKFLGDVLYGDIPSNSESWRKLLKLISEFFGGQSFYTLGQRADRIHLPQDIAKNCDGEMLNLLKQIAIYLSGKGIEISTFPRWFRNQLKDPLLQEEEIKHFFRRD